MTIRTAEGAKHIAWCKARACAYVDQRDLQGAFASMANDLAKLDETRDHIGIQLGMIQLLSGMLRTPEQMRHYINGFN